MVKYIYIYILILFKYFDKKNPTSYIINFLFLLKSIICKKHYIEIFLPFYELIIYFALIYKWLTFAICGIQILQINRICSFYIT